jgi:hypothetical protein
MSDAPTAEQVDDCRMALAAEPVVSSVDTIRADDRHGGRTTLDIMLVSDLERVPPRVLRTIQSHDMGVADVTPRVGFLTIVAT